MNEKQNNDMLIIGNGFDMSLGLKSSFTDFLGIEHGTYHVLNNKLKKFIDKCKNHDKLNKIQSFMSVRILENENYLKIRRLNHKYYKESNFNGIDQISAEGLDNASIEFFNKCDPLMFSKSNNYNFNFWALYFLLRKDESLLNWSDVETEIHNFLMAKNADLYEIYLYMSEYLGIGEPKFIVNNGRTRLSSTRIINILFRQNFSLDKFTINLLIYVLIHYSSDKGSFYNIFQYKNIHDFKTFKSLFLSYLKKQLYQFEYDLNDYLLLCLKNYKKVYGFSYCSIGELLLKQLTSNNKFSLLNFNYTNPLQNGLKENNYRRNIHGILNTEHNSRISPIIGISDSKININDPIYKFTKNYRIMRLSCNDYNNILNNHINSIKFFGHSFDIEDRHYLYEIFNNYHVEDGNIKLVFYYKPYGNQTDDSGAINQINNVISLFGGYFNGDSGRAVKFMDELSIYGNLIISNINDKIKNNDKLRAKFKKIQQINNEN